MEAVHQPSKPGEGHTNVGPGQKGPREKTIILANFPTFLREENLTRPVFVQCLVLWRCPGVRDLDPPPLGKPKCRVLQRKSNGFAMAVSTGNFGLRGSGT